MIEENIDSGPGVFMAAGMQQFPNSCHIRMCIGKGIDGPVQPNPRYLAWCEVMPGISGITFDKITDKIADNKSRLPVRQVGMSQNIHGTDCSTRASIPAT